VLGALRRNVRDVLPLLAALALALQVPVAVPPVAAVAAADGICHAPGDRRGDPAAPAGDHCHCLLCRTAPVPALLQSPVSLPPARMRAEPEAAALPTAPAFAAAASPYAPRAPPVGPGA
jgi:hypothetical protein